MFIRAKKASARRGFTLVELVMAVGILSVIVISASRFERDVFSVNKNIQSSMNAQLAARAVLRQFTSEVREASPSSLGAYPIAVAATSTFTFYADTNDDGLREQVRYYLSGTDFKKGVVSPTGNPLTYNPLNEVTGYVMRDVRNGSTPVFEYYNSSYDGTSAPLSFPINVSNVRLVKMTLLIDDDPNRAPDPFVLTTQVSIRNLKNNL